MPDPPLNPWVEKRRADSLRREKARLDAIFTALKAKNHSDPVKVRARKMVGQAVKRGDLRQLPCNWREKGGPACGCLPTEAHHYSYDRGQELKVRWLCKEHHDILSRAELRKKMQAAAEARRPRQERIEAPGVIVLED